MKKLKKNQILKRTHRVVMVGKGYGFYARLDFHKIDGRSGLGRMIKALKHQLGEFVGELSPVSELLIQRIIFKAVKLARYEADYFNNGVEEKLAAHYLPLANSLRNDLLALNELAGKKRPSNEWEKELRKITQEIVRG